MKIRLMQIIFVTLMVLAGNAQAAPVKTPPAMNMPMDKSDAGSLHAQSQHAKAKTNKPAPVHVDAAWVRAAPPGAMMMAAYMRVHNDGKTPLTFVSAHSDAFVMVELHRTQIENGVSSMRPAGDQAIKPGESMRLEPGGFHLMLMQPKRALKTGDKITFRLDFADGSSSEIVASVSDKAPGK